MRSRAKHKPGLWSREDHVESRRACRPPRCEPVHARRNAATTPSLNSESGT
jgi:hypothetical protein